MKSNSTLNLVEALRGNGEKFSTLFGFLSIGFLGLSIYVFGMQAKFLWVSFFAYFICAGFFLLSGNKLADENAWFKRLYMFLNGIQILLSLAGWIWVLYLAQENPGGRYTALVNLPFYYFLLFFLITFLTTFASLLFSLIGIHKKRKSLH